ncbi:stage II sporulation protein D [Halanaerobaculum tunisiense]
MKELISIIVIFSLGCLILLPPVITLFTTIDFASPEVEIVNSKTQQTMELELEEYIKGVLAAEMPAHFSLAALKAQAIAARTYTLRAVSQGNQLTTDSTVDQAWSSQQDLVAKWGLIDYLVYWSKLSAAVEETKGLVLTYEGDLIDAVYHSTSGGHTASAKEVWGTKVPYLQTVSSKYESNSPYYQVKKQFTLSELEQELGINNINPDQIEIIKLSASQRVAQLRIGRHIFSGREIRTKLGLPSTNFDLEATKEEVQVTTTGYGHGVGLSQYGAEGMAQEGYNFVEILHHYYPGIDFSLVKHD